MSDLVKIHKNFNRSAIPFYQEKAIDFFSEIMSKWNNSENFEPITFRLSELKKALGLDGNRNSEYFDKFVLNFVKDTTVSFFIGNNQIIGNVFFILKNEEKNIFKVQLNPMLLEYMFSRKDIELMNKAKNKRMSIEELELIRKNKEKYENLMIYSKSELQGLKGKYNKRLYMLLIQFKKTGIFTMDYPHFKNVLEIPEKYRQCDIDRHIFLKGKEELKKVGINITDIRKIKSENRIVRVEIHFTYNNKLTENQKTVELDMSNACDINLEVYERIMNIARKGVKKSNN